MKTSPATHWHDSRERGLTLAEVVVACALLSFLIAGIFGVAARCSAQLRSQQETAAASYAMEEAYEELRHGNWAQVTDAESLSSWLTAMEGSELKKLTNSKVKFTIAPYPPLSPQPAALCVERAADGTCTVISQPASGFSLRSMLAVRVDMRVSWTSVNKSLPRFREISSVIALSGIIK
jgi:hypothetical protein